MTGALRQLWQRSRFIAARQLRRPVAGRFQPYSFTRSYRYPWLFEFARTALQEVPAPRLLSFGCSFGDELVSLRRVFPDASIRGLDIAPNAIDHCRLRFVSDDRVSTAVAADTRAEPDDAYDAVFCLSVLCHSDLTVTRATRSDRLFPFARFDRAVADIGRCVRPGGFLFIHATNFRFEDTGTARLFEPVLEARQEQMAPALLYDRDDRLIRDERYYRVGFRKRTA